MSNKICLQAFLLHRKLIHQDLQFYGFLRLYMLCKFLDLSLYVLRLDFSVLSHIGKNRFFVSALNQIRKQGFCFCDNVLGFLYGILLLTEEGIYHDGLRNQSSFPSSDFHLTFILALRDLFLDIVRRSCIGIAIRFTYYKRHVIVHDLIPIG